MNLKSKRHHEINIAWSATMLLIFAAATIFTWLTPLHLDDWIFMSDWRDSGSENESFLTNLWNFYQNNRQIDNGRIANWVSPFSTVIKPLCWLFPVLNGLAFVLMIFFSQVLICGKNDRYNFRITVLLWILCLFLLPWRDTIFVADYSLNYIWSASLTLGFIIIMLKALDRNLSHGYFLFGLLMAFIAAGWHETFAITTIFGLLMLCLKKRLRISGYFYCLLAVYVISCIIFAVTPGMIRRFFSELSFESGSLSLYSIVLKTFPFLLLLLIIIASISFDKSRRILYEVFKSNLFLLFTGIIVSGYIISFSVIPTGRSFFWPDLSAIILCVFLIYKLLKPAFNNNLVTISAYIGIIICVLQAVFTIHWQIKYLKEYRSIMAQIDASDTGTAFQDVMKPGDLPYFSLKIPVQSAWINAVYYRCLWHYKLKPFVGVVPSVLREADIEESLPVAGNFETAVYKNQLISPFNPRLKFPTFIEGTVTLKNSSVKKVNGIGIPFVTDTFVHSDGEVKSDTLIYINLADINASDISSFNLNWINPEIREEVDSN